MLNLITEDSWFKIQENRTWDIFPFSRFREKRRKAGVARSSRLALDSAVLVR